VKKAETTGKRIEVILTVQTDWKYGTVGQRHRLTYRDKEGDNECERKCERKSDGERRHADCINSQTL
jgi:hypothetical protein